MSIAARLAVVDDVDKLVRILETCVQHGRSDIHSAAARIGVEFVFCYAGTHIRILKPAHLLHGNEFAAGASAAHRHIALVLF
jgi:hypothetical protein